MAAKDLDFGALQKSLMGRLVTPEMDEYEHVRKNFIARFDSIFPQVIVYCFSPQDVVESIGFARRHGMMLSVRSGGHCFAGFSLCPGMVIDVSYLKEVSYGSGYAMVGSGCRLGDMCDHLLHYDVTVPCGSCPSVGAGGTVLGGGLGILGRRYGLTCDHLVAAEVVLADGSIVACSEEKYQDLFWALRGAGAGNFGVVTSFTLKVRPAEPMTNFYLVWKFDHAAAVMSAWQDWAWITPDEMAAGLAFTMLDNLENAPIVELYGAMLADEHRTSQLLDGFIRAVGHSPSTDLRRHLPFRETQLFQAGLLKIVDSKVFEIAPSGQVERQAIRWTRSEYFRRAIPLQGAASLVRRFVENRRPGELRGLEFAPFGGEYNRISADSTAFCHRNEMFSLKHVAIVPTGADQKDQDLAHQWVTDSWSSVHPWGSGHVYPNFPDEELLEPFRAYYGDNYSRLKQIKLKYDPDNVFHFAHSIR